MAMSKTEDLPAEARARVVPTFCRSPIEAACARVRRERLSAGAPHIAIDDELAGLTSLNSRLAAAFGLSVAQGAQIRERVRRLGGDEAVSIVDWSRSGAHVLARRTRPRRPGRPRSSSKRSSSRDGPGARSAAAAR
jgi:hypothetical protein